MIRHTVFCRFRKDADIAAVATALKGLQQCIAGITAITFGADNKARRDCRRASPTPFPWISPTAAARDAYLPHPEHQKVGAMVVAALDGGLEGLAVVDWEV